MTEPKPSSNLTEASKFRPELNTGKNNRAVEGPAGGGVSIPYPHHMPAKAREGSHHLGLQLTLAGQGEGNKRKFCSFYYTATEHLSAKKTLLAIFFYLGLVPLSLKTHPIFLLPDSPIDHQVRFSDTLVAFLIKLYPHVMNYDWI